MESKLNTIVKSFANISEHASKAKKVLTTNPANIDLLASIIELDLALTSKILQIANSPFFGVSRKILSVKDAIVVIGLLSADNTITMAAVTNQLNSTRNSPPLDSKQLWLRSLVVACACKYYAKKFSVEPQEAFMLGMFHLIGRMAMNNCVQEYAQVVDLQSSKKCAMREAELECIGFDQEQLGVELVKKWHLPEIIELAISDKTHCSNSTPYLELLNLAKFIGQEMEVGDDYSYQKQEINSNVLERYHITQPEYQDSFNEISTIKAESLELIK
jgi:HD-like signal output (HDOD) protein